MTKLNSDIKLGLEKDILAKFPAIAQRIGLKKYDYSKANINKELFHINDKDKIMLYTTNHILLGGTEEIVASDETQFRLSATLFKDDKLVIHNVDFEFQSEDDLLLVELVRIHNLTTYLDNFKEIAAFVLERSDIVERVNPKLTFNSEGILTDIGLTFNYFTDFRYSGSKNYYTSSISLYNTDYNNFYSLNSSIDSLVFAKMSFLSIADENIQTFFECDDWAELYKKFRQNPEQLLSLYDMSRI